jgi:Zn-dependent protease with chaperone function
MALDPTLLMIAAAGTLVVVGGGSLFKIAQLRGGGRVVAEELGGRRITPDTSVPIEQRVVNVVEEMAIASGTPTPPVYLLDNEPGINAFASGFTPRDAVIGVTRGAAERLSRDELQGVIAHEFSHILNGDMRLNIRLIGLLHGILIIGMLGYYVLRATAAPGYRRRRSREGNPLPLLVLAAGLMAIGFFGTFFGNLIKAAVSRQREFLADAAAVQFTRHPEGLAGALKKIGGLVFGSKVGSPNAPEASHMFFGRATSGFTALFSTHPPLAERIRRIDSSWDGTFPALSAAETPGVPPIEAAGVAALSGGLASAPHGPGGFLAGALDDIGQPGDAHVRYAARLLAGLPPAVASAAHEPYGARAVVYALLLDRRPEPRRIQLAHLAAADPDVHDETLKLAPDIERLDVMARLPLVDVALPALRALTPAQYGQFKRNLSALVLADPGVDVFEWALQRIVLRDLETHHGRIKPPRVRFHAVAPLFRPCELLLSALAYAGHRSGEAAGRAFEEGWAALGLPPSRLRAPEDCGYDALDRALAALDEAAPAVKRRVLQAAVACIASDRTVTASEAELLRAVAASIGCPIPPNVM